VVESSPAVQPAKLVEMVAALASAIPELTMAQREDTRHSVGRVID
jgi:hypothetical protein